MLKLVSTCLEEEFCQSCSSSHYAILYWDSEPCVQSWCKAEIHLVWSPSTLTLLSQAAVLPAGAAEALGQKMLEEWGILERWGC